MTLPPELLPNFGDGRGRSGGGGCGLTVGRLGNDLDPVGECHTEKEFWQLVGAVETTPAFLRGFQQFEDHRERGWIACRPGFFLPVAVLSRLFRRLFLSALQKSFDTGELQFFSSLEPLRYPAAF